MPSLTNRGKETSAQALNDKSSATSATPTRNQFLVIGIIENLRFEINEFFKAPKSHSYGRYDNKDRAPAPCSWEIASGSAKCLNRETVERARGPLTEQMSPLTARGSLLDLFDKFRLEFHGANAVDATVNVMVACDQTNVFDFGAHFHHRG